MAVDRQFTALMGFDGLKGESKGHDQLSDFSADILQLFSETISEDYIGPQSEELNEVIPMCVQKSGKRFAKPAAQED